MDRGFSLAELLVGVSIAALLAVLALNSGGEAVARQRLEASARSLGQGIERARREAIRRGQPCGRTLGLRGWQAPNGGELASCMGSQESGPNASENSWLEASDLAGLELIHNLPGVVRFSSNGLVLDGGTVVLGARGTALRRCLVMALPLGVVRVGRYRGMPSQGPNSSLCEVDGSL
jgi:prepilin-type N-terminal cleavage/methylation domain-containing protein